MTSQERACYEFDEFAAFALSAYASLVDHQLPDLLH